MLRKGMSLNDQRFLFHPTQRTKHGESLRQPGKISYTCLQELFQKKVAGLGLSPSNFGLHSSRAGGATATANAKGLKRLFFQEARVLEVTSTKDGYVKNPIQSRLEVSRSLGLYP